MRVNTIVEDLKILGYKIGKVTQITEDLDGSIELSNNIHIQVGYTCAHVVKIEGDTFVFSKAYQTIDELIGDKTLKEAK